MNLLHCRLSPNYLNSDENFIKIYSRAAACGLAGVCLPFGARGPVHIGHHATEQL
jgi:hypothetical protein